MLTSVKGYYDGQKIVIEDDIEMAPGQEVIVTILNMQQSPKKIDLSKYVGRGEKMFDMDAQEYVKELRKHDRL